MTEGMVNPIIRQSMMDLITESVFKCKLQFIFSRNFSPSGEITENTGFLLNLVKKEKNWVKKKKNWVETVVGKIFWK